MTFLESAADRPRPEPGEHPDWTQDTLTRALAAALKEASPGAAEFTQVPHFGRVIDLLTVHVDDATPGVDILLCAFEVKVTRQDLMADLRNPAKQAPWRQTANRHYYVFPAGLVDVVNEPIDFGGSGVIEVWPNGDAGVTLGAAIRRKRPERQGTVIASLLRRGADLEAFHAGWVEQLDEARAVHVHLEQARADLAAEKRRTEAARERAEAWQMLAARQGHKVPCATCGAAIVPTRISAGVPGGWRHAQPHLTTDCPGNTRGVRPREDTP